MYFYSTKTSDVTPALKKLSACSPSLPFLLTGGSGSIIGGASSSFTFVNF